MLFPPSKQHKKEGSPSFRVKLNGLRHSAATILISIGVHPKVVQELLEHNNISMMLDIHSHVLPSIRQEAMNKLDDLFGSQK